MNLYGRLFLILLKALFARNYIAPHETCITRFRVWAHDLDFNLHMNNGRYLTLMDLARLDYMGQNGIAFETMRRLWFPILGETQMSFFRPLKIFEQFEVHTKIEYMDDKWIVMTQDFIKNGRLMASGKIRGLLKGAEGAVPPEKIISICKKFDQYQPIKSPSSIMKKWIQQLDEIRNSYSSKQRSP